MKSAVYSAHNQMYKCKFASIKNLLDSFIKWDTYLILIHVIVNTFVKKRNVSDYRLWATIMEKTINKSTKDLLTSKRRD
jgi:hypothetical protein